MEHTQKPAFLAESLESRPLAAYSPQRIVLAPWNCWHISGAFTSYIPVSSVAPFLLLEFIQQRRRFFRQNSDQLCHDDEFEVCKDLEDVESALRCLNATEEETTRGGINTGASRPATRTWNKAWSSMRETIIGACANYIYNGNGAFCSLTMFNLLYHYLAIVRY